MASYTTNYQLHQWEASDDFLRTDFNEDFAKIDAGIAAALAASVDKAKAVSGAYTGNGESTRGFNLGFQPIAVLVEVSTGGRDGGYSVRGGLAVTDGVLAAQGTAALRITASGFQAEAHTYASVNTSGTVYHYLAVR